MTRLTEQQMQAVFSTDMHVLVSAGAGSGKTHVLVERYVEIIRESSDLTVANIVAVTFTKKAAAEMRTRLKARFQNLYDEAPESEKSRWLECRSSVDGARINTIHSLCEGILKAFPVESGIDPQFEVLDDLERKELIEKSIDQAIREVIASQSEEKELLYAFNLDEIRLWLESVLASRLQYIEASQIFRDFDDDAFEKHFREFLSWARARAIASFAEDPSIEEDILFLVENEFSKKDNDLERVRASVGRSAVAIRSAGSLNGNLDALWQLLSEIAEVKVRAGGKSDEARALREAVKRVRGCAQEARKGISDNLNHSDERGKSAIISFIKIADSALSHYGEEKKKAFRLDFDDLIRLTCQALEKPDSEARKNYNSLFRAILVDEFQDTNKFQSKLLRLLAGPETRLFLIGDDKQSIYKFQGADVSIFNEWKDLFLKIGDGNLDGPRLTVSLSRSFRSHPALVAVVNQVFVQLLKSDGIKEPYRAQFEGLSASRDAEGRRHRLEVLEFDSTIYDSRKERDRYESLLVANWIKEQMRSGMTVAEKDGSPRSARYGDFAVLVQKNGDFASLEDALTEAEIPFVTLGGRSFLNRQEVYDVENLLRFLDNPNDSHSLLGALRSPMLSLSDDVIHNVKSGNDMSLWQALNQAAENRSDGLHSVSQAVRNLKVMLEDSQKLTLGELVGRIIKRTRYDIVLLGARNGRQRSRNLWKLVTLAAAHEDLTPGQFAERLALMRQFGVKQADAPLETHDVVKLMTIHGSKGLEFPVVILPALSSSVYNFNGRFLMHRHYGIAINTSRDKDEPQPAWFQLALKSDRHMEIEERKRLLYVAMTRARDYLAVLLDVGGRPSESFRSWLSKIVVPPGIRGDEPELVRQGGTEWLVRACRIDDCQNGAAESECLDEVASKSLISGGSNEAVRLDLIEPMAWRENELKSDTEVTRRVTPRNGEVHVDATVVGTFFHALMEHLLHSARLPDRAFIEDVAFSQGEAAAHPALLAYMADEGARLIEKFSASLLYEMMLYARRRLKEMPYLRLVDGSLETKRPDLLLEDAEGCWHLIDYKTDHIEEFEIEKQAGRYFNKQLLPYARELKELMGITCRPAIYFAQLGILHHFAEEDGEPMDQINDG